MFSKESKQTSKKYIDNYFNYKIFNSIYTSANSTRDNVCILAEVTDRWTKKQTTNETTHQENNNKTKTTNKPRILFSDDQYAFI